MAQTAVLSCSLSLDTSGHASKRRRVRHQHFWRNSDKLPPEHRLYVTSAEIKNALEQVRMHMAGFHPNVYVADLGYAVQIL